MRWPVEQAKDVVRAARRVAAALGLGLSLLPAAVWPATPVPATQQTFPFSQALDLRAVVEATTSPPQALLATLARWGVDVRVVRAPGDGRARNPLLAGVPEAGADLLRQAEFRESYEGRLVCRGDRCCGLARDTILIRETASTCTLLHEFIHAQLQPLCPASSPDDEIEQRFGAAHRRLQLYQRRLYDDPYKLLDPRWRRDIHSAQADVVQDLFDRIRFGQAQEVIAEVLLARHVTEDNPYHDRRRRDEGRRYAVAMVDNAIDLVNQVEASIAFVEEAVRHLRAEVLAGRIVTGEGVALDDGQALQVALDGARLRERLAPTREEVLRLKAFAAAVVH